MKEDKIYTKKKLTIKEWGVQDRPREKYVASGAVSLSDAELIAILIRTGNAHESAVDLSKKILANSDNSLNKLSQKTLSELSNINGIGRAKAVTLLSSFELCRRIESEGAEEKSRIETCIDVLNLMQKRIAHLKHEEFWAVYMTNAHDVIKVSQLSKGGLTNTAVDVRIIFHEALQVHATSLIVCHNHPSGRLVPSKADKEVTKKIKDAGKLMEVNLVDHIIIHERNYFSFVESGLL